MSVCARTPLYNRASDIRRRHLSDTTWSSVSLASSCGCGSWMLARLRYQWIWKLWRRLAPVAKKKRNKTSVIMQFGGLAKTLGKSQNVEWEPSCTNDGRLYPQRLQTRSRTESVLGHRDVTARGHIVTSMRLIWCARKKKNAACGANGHLVIYIYIYIITRCPSQALNRDS